MNTLPTIVLVHGAWHTPASYQTYIEALQERGFQVHCPHLPTCSGVSPPTASLSDDIVCVNNVVQSLVDAGDRVLLLMHSYGGVVGSSAIDGLSWTERQAAGQPGGVIHLLYLCAYILDAGVTPWSILQEAKVDHLWSQVIDTDSSGLSCFRDPNMGLFSRRADQDIVDKALQTMVRFPDAVMHCPTTGAAWKTIPTTYISTLDDWSVLNVYQQIMLERVRKQGIEVKLETYDADHSLFITRQEEMVEEAFKAATDERNAL
ncbi:hypothetical protein BBP40_007350 [Aspergillus hancockii]|nr:hypothetical protein BBP40_007350 [Aspergillus hancockii]